MTAKERRLRQAVINEALTWVDTPFHHEARIKEVGVDCGQLLIAAYQAARLVQEDFSPSNYSSQWHLHRSEELYLELIESLGGRRIEQPGPGDVAIWQIGRTHSHAAIVIAWPAIVHASAVLGACLRDDARRSPMQLERHPVLFYSLWSQ